MVSFKPNLVILQFLAPIRKAQILIREADVEVEKVEARNIFGVYTLFL